MLGSLQSHSSNMALLHDVFFFDFRAQVPGGVNFVQIRNEKEMWEAN